MSERRAVSPRCEETYEKNGKTFRCQRRRPNHAWHMNRQMPGEWTILTYKAVNP